MNLAERIFFSNFLLWSKKGDEKEFAGLNALMTLGISIWFNIGTIVMIVIGIGSVRFETPVFFGVRSNWLIVSMIWFITLGFYFLRKSKIKKYRSLSNEINPERSKKIRMKALLYIISSALIFFLVAFSVVANLD